MVKRMPGCDKRLIAGTLTTSSSLRKIPIVHRRMRREVDDDRITGSKEYLSFHHPAIQPEDKNSLKLETIPRS